MRANRSRWFASFANSSPCDSPSSQAFARGGTALPVSVFPTFVVTHFIVTAAFGLALRKARTTLVPDIGIVRFVESTEDSRTKWWLRQEEAPSPSTFTSCGRVQPMVVLRRRGRHALVRPSKGRVIWGGTRRYRAPRNNGRIVCCLINRVHWPKRLTADLLSSHVFKIVLSLFETARRSAIFARSGRFEAQRRSRFRT
jgi:hypothetical protein